MNRTINTPPQVGYIEEKNLIRPVLQQAAGSSAQKRSIVLACLLTTAIISSCSPTKGYTGPDLPENKVSLISYTEDGSGKVTVNTGRVGNYSFSSSGINVLPGEHRVELDIRVKGYPQTYTCRPEPSFDSYGYKECNKKRVRNDNYTPCDCFDYLTIYSACQVEVADGMCSGDLMTLPGGKYTVNVRKLGMAAEASCLSCGLGGPVTFTCSQFNSSFDEERTSQGTGRSTAYAAGIYNCGNYY